MLKAVMLVALLAAVAQASVVPILAWTSEASLLGAQPALRFGQTLLAHEAVEACFAASKTAKAVMVAFVVDELSMEDLSAAALAGESLKNLESLVESSSNSVVLPLVAGSVVHELATTIRLQQGSVVSMTTSEFMSATLASSNALYIVRVTTSKSDSKELTLAKLDAYVAAAMKRVAGRSVVAILTSNTESPSLLPETASETIAVARRAFSQPNLANINLLSQKVNKDYMYFTIPIFMGIVVGLFMVFVVLVGISGIMATQTPDQFANTNDKPLQVPQ